jgi:membrane peptidoglycan carboxypeptidase
LKKMPAAGKTGTAYDFTDALFAGYDSNFTCAIWTGFDKPQKIYRGAFGRELALPIWVDIMNAAGQKYPPREIREPSNLNQVETCWRSGLLATDKCYDPVKSASGDTVQRRTTYMEVATSSQTPSEPCNVHGEPRTRLVRDLPPSDLPRAALAVDLSEVTPVPVKNPTLLADKDPYNSLKPTLKSEPTPEPEMQTAENQTMNNAAGGSPPTPTPVEGAIDLNRQTATGSESAGEPVNQTAHSDIPIRKAIPVQPQDKGAVEIRRALPVKPLDQESAEETLLKSATPPPSDLYQ